MGAEQLASSVLSYVFTTIIYLFILAVIGIVYMDIRKMNSGDKKSKTGRKRTGDGSGETFALLRTVRTPMATSLRLNPAYRISGKGIVVGRGKRCDIICNDMYLSAAHFQIWCEEDRWYIRDMDSKNGTYLNGSKLKKIKQLKSGSEIAFGELKFIFEEEGR